MIRLLHLVIFIFLTQSLVYAQDGINYQGAATNSNGDELSTQNISIRASILSGSATGNLEWQETHSTTTDQFGLFNIVIGQGTNTANGATANFNDMDWGSGNHFLKIEMDATGGTNYNLIGTTQMMSVPYALYAKNSSVNVSISTFGDTLTLNGQSIIVPGISYQNTPSSIFGAVTDINGNTYQTVTIGTQEWMMENLIATSFSNGDPITLQINTNTSCNVPAYRDPQGNGSRIYYNGYTILDNRNVCPSGWHVPSKADYEILLDNFGTYDGSHYWIGAGPALKSTSGWDTPFFTNNNSHLNFMPNGMMYCSSNSVYGAFCTNCTFNERSWTSTQGNGTAMYYLDINQNSNDVGFGQHYGYPSDYLSPVRCVKD